MTITDEARNHLYNSLREKLGAQDAATMMELLPSAGWADVATKRDLDHVSAHLANRIELLGAELRGEWRRDLLGAVFALIAANVAVVGAVFAAAKLS